MAYLLTVDGLQTQLDVDKLTLPDLQRMVSGYVEIVRASAERVLIVDEEGRLKDKPLNVHASRLAGQVIVGDVIVFLADEFKRWDDRLGGEEDAL